MPKNSYNFTTGWEVIALPLSKLCRRRHNLDHADTYFMPTSSEKPLPGKVEGVKVSA